MKQIVRFIFLVCLVSLFVGCVGISNNVELSKPNMSLLNGVALFGEPVEVSESTALDPLRVNDEMRAFVGDIASAKPETCLLYTSPSPRDRG